MSQVKILPLHGTRKHAFVIKIISHPVLLIQSMSAEKEKTFIKNKAAQIFSLAFVTDYPHRWPNFLLDILQSLANGGAQGVEVYLRILKAIDSEVVDREIVHTHQVRN